MEESRHWKIIPPRPEQARELSRALSISPVTAQLLINRGIGDAKGGKMYLRGTLADLHDPLLLDGLQEAVNRVLRALREGTKIRIFGDYDVDGVTSTVMLLTCIERLGGKSVDYYIPHRIEEGYGLSRKGIEHAAEEGVGLIITVDCGVGDADEIALAKDLGMEIIVTDHHQVPRVRPRADVLVNPWKSECPYPFKDLAGVGVTFKLVQALLQEAKAPCPDDFLQLAALGTVADSVPLVGENRILLKEGMQRMSARPLPAIAALISERSSRARSLDVRELNFSIIPALNAAGRMGDVDVALDALRAEDPVSAAALVKKLLELNRSRKKIEETIRKEIMRELDENETGPYPYVVMAREGWHPGVLGITASRIAEKVKKPVFLIALKEGVGRGSARSWGGVNLFELMGHHSDLLLHYGGHEGAGGFGIEERHIPEFSRRLKEEAPREGRKGAPGHDPACDMEIDLHDVTLQLVKEIAECAPFGEGNALPMFLFKGMKIEDCELVGAKAHLRVQLSRGPHSMKGIAFKKGEVKALLEGDLLYDILGSPERDEYNGSAAPVIKIAEIGYPDRNSELVIKAPHRIILPGHESGHQTLPVIIDSRNVGNRLRYISEVGSHARSAVVVLRKESQQMEVRELLRQKGLDVMTATPSGEGIPPRGLIVTYPHLLSKISSADDIIFLSPPPSIQHFALPLYRRTGRIHFLFTVIDIDDEECLQRLFEPEPGKMAKIQKVMDALRRKGIAASSPAGIARILKDPSIKEITVQFAFRIFDELNLLRRLGAGYELIQTPCLKGEDLVRSDFFTTLKDSRESFARLTELYRANADGLRSEILSMIGKIEARNKPALIC
jgi:single-stranded-DNA-specific exonuclease RecJ